MEMDKAGGGTGIIGTSVLPVGEQGLLTSTSLRLRVCACVRACIYVHAEGDYFAKYAGVSTEV